MPQKVLARDDVPVRLAGNATTTSTTALRRRVFLTPEKAQPWTPAGVRLLFQSGSPRRARHQGLRAAVLDMNVMAGLMAANRAAGWRVATMPGKFTRLTLTLPQPEAKDDTEAA